MTFTKKQAQSALTYSGITLAGFIVENSVLLKPLLLNAGIPEGLLASLFSIIGIFLRNFLKNENYYGDTVKPEATKQPDLLKL